jgi:hypothetical protein
MLTWEDDVEIHALHNGGDRSRRSPATLVGIAGRSATTSTESPRPGGTQAVAVTLGAGG